MARIRAVKPSIRTSRVVLSWPEEVRYFWVLLWGYLDDEGRGLDSAKMIAGDCYPLDDKITATVVERRLVLFATSKIGDREPPLCRYEVDGTRYIHSVNWDDNQKVNRPRPSVHPHCPIHEPSSDVFTAPFSEPSTDDALKPHVLEGGRGKGEEGRGSATSEPLTELPPPLGCKRHPGGADDPCHACRKAREAHEAWQAAKRARIADAPRCPSHPDQPAANCASCRSEQIGAA
jgi:hypothetical protein